MLITYGIVDFSNIQHSFESYNTIDQFVKIGTNTLFPFVVLTDNTGAAATMDVLDINGDTVQAAISLTVATNEDAKQISFAGSTLTGKECGQYQLKITHSTNTYYSEFFEWSDDLTELAKITVDPGKILINNYYTIDLSALTFIAYVKTAKSFNTRVLTFKGETVEEGSTKNYGDEPLKATINFEYELELIGNEALFKFLAMIRPSTVDGSSAFEFRQREKMIYNTTVEQAQNNNFGENMVIKFTFREQSFISNSNE